MSSYHSNISLSFLQAPNFYHNIFKFVTNVAWNKNVNAEIAAYNLQFNCLPIKLNGSYFLQAHNVHTDTYNICTTKTTKTIQYYSAYSIL